MDTNLDFIGALKERRSLLIVCLMAVFYSTGAGALWFLLPLLADKFTNDIILVGMLLSVPYVVSTIVAIPSGALSDRVGRKTIGIIGLMIVVFIGIILPYVDSLDTFIIFILILGLSIQLINAPARAFIMDISPDNRSSEYFGIFTSFINLGLATGPVIVGFLMKDTLSIGVTVASYMYVAFGLIGIAIFTQLPDPVTEREPLLTGIRNLFAKDGLFKRGIREYSELKNLGLLILLLTVLFTVLDGLTWTLEPLYYPELGLNSDMGSLIFSMFILPLIVFGLPAGYLADKYGKTKALVAGLGLSGASLIMFGTATNPAMLLMAAFLTAAGMAFSWASVSGLITDISKDRGRGNITGVWNTSMDLGYVIGPLLGGIAANFLKIGNTFTLMGIILLSAAVIALKHMRTK